MWCLPYTNQRSPMPLSQQGCHGKHMQPCAPHGSPDATTRKVFLSHDQEMLRVAALARAQGSVHWTWTNTAFLSDICRRGTSKSTALSEIEPLIPTPNHPLTNYRSPPKYRGVIATQRKSTHLSRSENKHLLSLFYSQECLKFSGHHFPKENN